MLSYMSVFRFLRARISILISKIILGHLEADLEASQVQIWRSHTICLHVCLNIGLLGSGFQFLCLKLKFVSGGCWRLILVASQVQILRSYTICLHVCLIIGLLGPGFQFLC
jgi:hypothetical protein